MNLENDKTEYIVAFVSEFAKKYNLSAKEAFNYLDRFKAVDFLERLCMRFHFAMTVPQALRVVYNSKTYKKLINPRTGLYFQSPLYVYDFLKNEVLTGKLS